MASQDSSVPEQHGAAESGTVVQLAQEDCPALVAGRATPPLALLPAPDSQNDLHLAAQLGNVSNIDIDQIRYTAARPAQAHGMRYGKCVDIGA